VLVDVLVNLMAEPSSSGGSGGGASKGEKDESVRAEAVLSGGRIVEVILMSGEALGENEAGHETLGMIFGTLIGILNDSSPLVRAALAESAGLMLVLLSSEANKSQKPQIDEVLIPLVQRLLHDPVQLVVSAALGAVASSSVGSALSLSQITKLLPTLLHLGQNDDWRVRVSAVEVIPSLVNATAGVEGQGGGGLAARRRSGVDVMAIRAEIGKIVSDLLEDKVWEVRVRAAKAIVDGVGAEKDEGSWFLYVLFPQLQSSCKSAQPRLRMTGVEILRLLLMNANGKNRDGMDWKLVVDMLEELSKDKIPNVRIGVARMLGEEQVIVNLKPEFQEVLETMVESLMNDTDRDVRRFARISIDCYTKIMED